jgi:uncharacterized protein (UPF0332 family)
MTTEQEALIRKAQDSLRAAKLLNENDLIDFAASRAYYAMFYVAGAFLHSQGLKFSKHGSLIAAFGLHFVKAGLIPAHYHQNLIKGYNKRVIGDYTTNSTLTKTEAATMITQAEEFLTLAEQMLGAQPPAKDQSETEGSSEQG